MSKIRSLLISGAVMASMAIPVASAAGTPNISVTDDNSLQQIVRLNNISDDVKNLQVTINLSKDQDYIFLENSILASKAGVEFYCKVENSCLTIYVTSNTDVLSTSGTLELGVISANEIFNITEATNMKVVNSKNISESWNVIDSIPIKDSDEDVENPDEGEDNDNSDTENGENNGDTEGDSSGDNENDTGDDDTDDNDGEDIVKPEEPEDGDGSSDGFDKPDSGDVSGDGSNNTDDSDDNIENDNTNTDSGSNSSGSSGGSSNSGSSNTDTNVGSDDSLIENDTEDGIIEQPEFNMSFIDVKSDAWYYNAVKYVCEKGIMVGISDTKFAPDISTTRGMFVTMLYRLENEPNIEHEDVFDDVKSSDYYYNAVYWAKQHNIVTGVSKTKFDPNNNITREQMITMLYRYAIFKGYDVDKLSNLVNFKDVYEISEYALNPFKWAVEANIITGLNNNFISPASNASRGQIATILMRFIENM